jgi:hypothetical protein
MPIIAFNFDRMLVAKLKDVEGPLSMKPDLNLKDIKKKELPVGEVLQMDFEFKLVYDPKFAELELGGYFYYLGDKKEIDGIENEWKKKKKLGNQELMTTFVNTILLKCNLQALLLEKEIGLPLHLRLPSVAPAENTKKKASKKK